APRCEDRGEGVHVVDQLCRLGPQVCPPGWLEPVVSRASRVFRDAPLGRDQLPRLHAVQRLEERSVLDGETSPGPILEPTGDLEAVHRTPRESFENEDVERSLEQRHFGLAPPSVYP